MTTTEFVIQTNHALDKCGVYEIPNGVWKDVAYFSDQQQAESSLDANGYRHKRVGAYGVHYQDIKKEHLRLIRREITETVL